MNFSAWSINRPLPAILVFILLGIVGLVGFQQLAVSRFPDIAFPGITVTVVQPSATPAQLETEVARKIEDSIATLPGIKNLVSTVVEGSSTTFVEFRIGKDLNEALDEVRDAVTRVRTDLPQDVEEPIVAKIDVVGGTLVTYAVASDAMAEDELSWFVDNDVTKAMFGVPGVGQVTRAGGIDREVQVDLRPGVLQAYGLTAGQVSQQLAASQLERSGGRATWGSGEQAIRAVGTVASAQDLRAFPIRLPDGRQVPLSALAEVTDGHEERRQVALLDGKPVVAFAITRTRGSSEIDVGAGVEEAVRELEAQHPGVKITPVFSAVQEVQASYKSSMTMLWEGSLLAVVVVWFFLRDWRATWISAVALPLSIIPTFGVMWLFGFSLNMITLLALAVVVGILVDDAIVEVENIDRHLGMGKPPKQAATDAADEIGLAVIATSATLAAVFVPVAFMPGVAGKFFLEFGWTAATAVLFSLMVARLLTPMMAAYQLKPKPHPEEKDGRLMRWYLGWVEWALAHRFLTLLAAFLMFVGSLGIAYMIPATFIPGSDLGRSNLSLELPPGARLDQTVAVAERARKLIADIPELKQAYATVGGVVDFGDPNVSGIADVRKVVMVLDWGLADGRERSQKELEREVRERLRVIPGVRQRYISSEPGEQMQVVLAGNDPKALYAAAQSLDRDLRTIQGLGTISSTASLLRPELVIVPDARRAADLGVSTVDIAEAARIATSGDYRQRLAKLNLADRQVPIRVRMAEESLSDEALLSLMRVPSANGGTVPLSAVASIRTGSGPSVINRLGRERQITFTAELSGRPLGDVMQEVNELPTLKNLPPGVRTQPFGDAEIFVELFVGFALAMAAGLFCVYAVLLLLFNHASHPLIILMAVPLSAGGAFGLMFLTGTLLSLPALIGLLMLIGIATKNSILLVDYAVIAEDEKGMNMHDALVDACRKRARPVIMTSIAMSAGMLPIALGFGADAAFRQPMAVAVIGGLITSTVLSLVVIPAAFAAMEDITRRFTRRGTAASTA
ncbi:efflux RND transporter permease subunit [Arenimonas terrae]|uniref:Efflux RND transporter permease subunit n=1 Tax=Arenimonas terrae TaxID=2546226 RepID=A0A5C4RQG9_9GAMM|nr:efflux RND transporter permease subunit [Arenimonas terrae]TNJ32847.1 efflux RND transporter permease subunit [Arenimonas terrae]